MRQLRLAAGFRNRADLAKQIGLDPETLNNLENDKSKGGPNIVTLTAFAKPVYEKTGINLIREIADALEKGVEFVPTQDNPIDDTSVTGVSSALPLATLDAHSLGGVAMDDQDRASWSAMAGAFALLMNHSSKEIRAQFSRDVVERAVALLQPESAPKK